MRKLTADEIKARELNILIYIDKICEENNIEYFLTFGTLIGAIRHKGFIPWDDDIDIVMKREEYEKFIKIFPRENDKKYKLLNIDENPNYYYPFLKVIDGNTKVDEKNFKAIDDLGLWVDVFPLDNYDENITNEKKVKLIKQKLHLSRETRCVKSKKKIKTFVKKILHPFYKNKDPRMYGLQMNQLGKKVLQTNKEYCVLFSLNFKKCILNKDWYERTIDCEFEGYKFKAPEKYHEILTQIYGDYMQLPPENQRISGHNIDAYLLY